MTELSHAGTGVQLNSPINIGIGIDIDISISIDRYWEKLWKKELDWQGIEPSFPCTPLQCATNAATAASCWLLLNEAPLNTNNIDININIDRTLSCWDWGATQQSY